MQILFRIEHLKFLMNSTKHLEVFCQLSLKPRTNVNVLELLLLIIYKISIIISLTDWLWDHQAISFVWV